MKIQFCLFVFCLFVCSVYGSAEVTITIGTVNNGDMIRMQKLSSEFERMHEDIRLEWVILEENTLRQRLTTDISTGGGAFDVMTIGMYEAPIWGERKWLEPLSDLPENYDVNDIFPAVRDGLSVKGQLFALPFYAESSLTYYRKDLFLNAEMTMPHQPSWNNILNMAKKLHKPAKNQYGICLRGKAGWGENMALITTMSNAFGARWFDERWEPEFDGAAWKETLSFYVEILESYGPPGAVANGFNENLALFNSGNCAIWVDASVAASFITDPTQSKVADSVGFALTPSQVKKEGTGWLWAWALAIPTTSEAKDAARQFILWATSKDYIKLVAKTNGIANVPPGTRQSTYSTEYRRKAQFADITLTAMANADPVKSTLAPKPYLGVQFVAIPEFQGIATQVGKLFAGTLTGNTSVDQALVSAQKATKQVMQRSGYLD